MGRRKSHRRKSFVPSYVEEDVGDATTARTSRLMKTFGQDLQERKGMAGLFGMPCVSPPMPSR